jgi:hypothetical protein
MNKMRFMPLILVAFLLTVAFASIAQAQTARSFVASTGFDTNTATNCPRANPCRNFLAAYGITSVGGEIVALDTAGFGGVTITHAVTIEAAPGVFGLVAVSPSTAGIVVAAGATDKVVLTNIEFSCGGSASSTGLSQSSGNVIMIGGSVNQCTTGVFVSGGTTTLQGVNITNNTLGVQAQGQGPDLDANTGGCTPTHTVVRIAYGLIAFNITAFEMDNPGSNNNASTGGTCPSTGFPTAPNCGGTRSQGASNSQNIFLLNTNGGNGYPNIVGNPTFLVATGLMEQQPNPVPPMQTFTPQIGNYSSQTQQMQAGGPACGFANP